MKRLATPLVVLAIGVICFTMYFETNGPDFPRYFHWALVAKASSFEALGGMPLPDRMGSPLGLPFSQWPHGAGFLMALPNAILPGLPMLDSARLAGAAAAFLFWVMQSRIMLTAARGSVPLSLLGLLLLFVGTPVGYYSMHISSEVFSLALLSFPVLWLLRGRPVDFPSTIGLASALALLTIVRLQLGFYVILFAYLYAERVVTEVRGNHMKRWYATLLLVVAGVIVGCSAAQQLVVQYWMTGDPLKSPYNGEFQDLRLLDWFHPALIQVLSSPTHGLFVYHPFFAVAAAVFLWLLVKARNGLFLPKERLLLGLVMGLHLWMIAAHLGWWGGWSFGMRYLVFFALFLVPEFVRLVCNLIEAGKKHTMLVLVVMGCCMWSYLLLVHGPTLFVSFGGLISSQVVTAHHFTKEMLGLGLIVGLLYAWSWRSDGALRLAASGRATGVKMLGMALLCANIYVAERFGALAENTRLLLRRLDGAPLRPFECRASIHIPNLEKDAESARVIENNDRFSKTLARFANLARETRCRKIPGQRPAARGSTTTNK